MEPTDLKCSEGNEVRFLESYRLLVLRAISRYRPSSPPPNWNAQEWRTELYHEAQAALWEAVNDYNPTYGLSFEQFAYWRVCARLKTFVRREWNYQQSLDHRDEQSSHDLSGIRNDRLFQEQIETRFASLLVEQLEGQLSASEIQLWRWVTEGRSFRWIGAQLGISHTLARRRWQKLRERLRNFSDASK